MAKGSRDASPRFGIGEWYGNNLLGLSSSERRAYASEALLPKKARLIRACPFQSRKKSADCKKDGGVCSLRLYAPSTDPQSGETIGVPVQGKQGELRATCPYRFQENLDVFKWVGETILGDPDPLLAGEVGFLESSPSTDSFGGDDVGRIDMVLVSTKTVPGAPMVWAALEVQAVYFSGDAMRTDFEAVKNAPVDRIPFPAGRRRPDYRSSGPKRLMPQLQIKVPTLRRWGKKMAVVVDRAFFDSLGEMDDVPDISNADIAWFIVRFEDRPGEQRARLVRDGVRYTTLERATEGLTGGKPFPLPIFETRIHAKVLSPSPPRLVDENPPA